MSDLFVLPGTFDPPTNGHLDLIRRAASLCSTLIVAPAEFSNLFPLDQRVAFLKELTKDLAGVEVEGFSGLAIDFARKKGARCLIRGLRGPSDFEHESRMSQMNRELGGIETLFLSSNLHHISSSLIREIALCGGDLSPFVPPSIAVAISQINRQSAS